MMSIDYSTWMTKQQAADAIGVTTKPIERLAQSKHLEQARWKRPTGGPRLAVYNPDDVARIVAQAQLPTQPFELPVGHVVAANVHHGLVRQSIDDDGVRAFLLHLQDLLQTAASQTPSHKI